MKRNPFLRCAFTVTACAVLALTCSGCRQSNNPSDAATTTTIPTTVADTTTDADATTDVTKSTENETTAPTANETAAPTADKPSPTKATAPAPSTPSPLSDAQQQQIRQDYYDSHRTNNPDDQMTMADVTIQKHIATYGDSVVLFMNCPGFAYDDAFWTVEYEGFSFHFTNGQRPLVYRGGEFVTFQKAYESGWLTRDNLYDLSLHFPETE